MDARTLILMADKAARDRGMNQSQWSARAGFAVNGQTGSRIVSRGDCRVSTLLALLEPLGLCLTMDTAENVEKRR